eukprot:1470677-Pyramimonas_sp.AAC.1
MFSLSAEMKLLALANHAFAIGMGSLGMAMGSYAFLCTPSCMVLCTALCPRHTTSNGVQWRIPQ